MTEISRLGVSDAGEILTLQRAAFVAEAQLHDDLALPALTQTMDELLADLANPAVIVLGIRVVGRLVASARIHVRGDVADLGRLMVVPDLQGRGLGSRLLKAVDSVLPDSVRGVELFTGSRSVGNLRLYRRFGFRETGRESAGHYDVVAMRRDIE
ncbi:GNAT family N-acetyltransferase [Rhodococcus rhodnii]|uniref:N-acetyltransferase domain-containing protein n=2 Tax=Rhodococcus rhodnii TaxID=38312 RepID=R7WLI3_9NOCA|nr:GNAT family N-acetyltransferase [Rhodococcus rhodnii]EOM76181.1 hypothetical protein Rrhod_2547 [Rhodococcus rhodnii LMG 5362]TXG91822.1 GNAT family N-acetyltransferase [Rhodococcus rhodnii]